ncbi:12423_t:CDS:2 [Racocetra fulgida]|uniref:12423_t:CDS:1 n=1 Tax=Racocetra fulgida TaxID=60492 RepID=A0A9N8WD39_9GLOM|nr:12423_t:CDS:2 [Racocetra fulgida]
MSKKRLEDEDYVPSDDESEGEEEIDAQPKTKGRRPKKKDADNNDDSIAVTKKQDSNDKENKKPKKHQEPTGNEDKKNKKKEPLTDAEKEDIIKAENEILKKVPLPSSLNKIVGNKKNAIIGSMNIQAFGAKKTANEAVMRIVVDILKHYDIILCQEVHVPEGKEEMIKNLIKSISTSSTPYDYVMSKPIGRNSYQERYLYLYKKNDWEVIDNYVIDDDTKLGDKFIRDPFVARFQHRKHSDVKINLVGCHTQPEKAYDEIKALITDVYPMVKKKLGQTKTRGIPQQSRLKRKEKLDKGVCSNLFSFFRSLFRCYRPDVEKEDKTHEKTRDVDTESSEPIVLMGDFNASGSYLNKTERNELDELLEKGGLTWGIGHKTDTTVADTDAAYDRFVFELDNKDEWIGDTRVWRFDDGWANKVKKDPDLVKKAAKRVSDHYPIEFDFRLANKCTPNRVGHIDIPPDAVPDKNTDERSKKYSKSFESNQKLDKII